MTKKSLATKRKRGLINPKIKGGNLSQVVGKLRRIYPRSKITIRYDMIVKDGKFLAWRKGNMVDISLLPELGTGRELIGNRCNPKRKLPKRHAPLRMLKQYERDYLEKTLGRSWGLMPKPTIMRVLKKLKSLKPNPQPVIIYDKLLGIEARKSHGKFAGENFKHDFSQKTNAQVLGLPNGSLLVRSTKGKRLWKKFQYD